MLLLIFVLTLCTLGKKISRQHIKIFFLIFVPQVLTFHTNGDNLHEMLNSVFWENKKNISLLLAE